MQMEIDVQMKDGRTLTARPGMREMVEFEREFDKPASVFADEQRITWLMFLVHRALRDEVADDFDEFLDNIETLDTEDVEDADPSAGKEARDDS